MPLWRLCPMLCAEWGTGVNTQVVFITGALTGIGRATALALQKKAYAL